MGIVRRKDRQAFRCARCTASARWSCRPRRDKRSGVGGAGAVVDDHRDGAGNACLPVGDPSRGGSMQRALRTRGSRWGLTRLALVASALVVLVVAAISPGATAAQNGNGAKHRMSVTLLAHGLQGTVGSTIGPDGAVYVAEAGTGPGTPAGSRASILRMARRRRSPVAYRRGSFPSAGRSTSPSSEAPCTCW